tara:strand:+ start:4993 stop:5205 length:213 start_codon:yes stop_codon:yes gene_type:complete
MIDFSMSMRNGFGVDLCLLPKEYAVGYKEGGECNMLSLQYFRLLLPLVAVHLGTITVLDEEVPREYRDGG